MNYVRLTGNNIHEYEDRLPLLENHIPQGLRCNVVTHELIFPQTMRVYAIDPNEVGYLAAVMEEDGVLIYGQVAGIRTDDNLVIQGMDFREEKFEETMACMLQGFKSEGIETVFGTPKGSFRERIMATVPTEPFRSDEVSGMLYLNLEEV